MACSPAEDRRDSRAICRQREASLAGAISNTACQLRQICDLYGQRLRPSNAPAGPTDDTHALLSRSGQAVAPPLGQYRFEHPGWTEVKPIARLVVDYPRVKIFFPEERFCGAGGCIEPPKYCEFGFDLQATGDKLDGYRTWCSHPDGFATFRRK